MTPAEIEQLALVGRRMNELVEQRDRAAVRLATLTAEFSAAVLTRVDTAPVLKKLQQIQHETRALLIEFDRLSPKYLRGMNQLAAWKATQQQP